MPILGKIKGSVVEANIWAPLAEVESVALDQIRNVASLPWVFHHVAVMSDCHYGKGCTIGSVVALKNAVSPAMCGVDIACGMGAIRTSLTASDLPDSLQLLRHKVEKAIPVGFNGHEETVNQVSKNQSKFWSRFRDLDPKVADKLGTAKKQMGTLGGGNHFIELCLDEEQRVWIMLHSGSRNIGKTLAEIHIGRAKKLIHNQDLPDKDLAVFLSGTREMQEYLRDLKWAQEYAMLNRSVMMELYIDELKKFFKNKPFTMDQPILCHHNYISEENHFGEDVIVTRKGAISAQQGEYGVIPGSMGTKSFIVRGLGNPDSFCSASHGAGRRMSRGKAKRTFTLRDLEQQTAGVECRKDAGVLDEIPSAYKPIEIVMQHQSDLVEVVHTLKQCMCIKG
jgi:tRNA-splicing ligase RtcB